MTIAGRQRLDKWLWFARVVKSRTLAGKLVMDGFVRVNSVKADAPAKPVGPGDVLTIALERQVRILKVLAPGVRRGPYEEARTLYEDCSPPPEARDETPGFGERERGTGRPTKKERRSHDAIFGSGKVE